jgi:pilus assembly protein Flp/PilA
LFYPAAPLQGTRFAKAGTPNGARRGAGNRQEPNPMKKLFLLFAGDKCGVTAIEYGMIVALISIGIITSVELIGTTIAANFFGPIATALAG